MNSARLLLTLAIVVVPATALAQIPIGTRVGKPVGASAYDDGGRPDPFNALVTAKRTVAPTNDGTPIRNDRLASLAVSEVRCTGVMRQGATRYASAILEGPNKLSFVVKPNDRLLDGVVKSIDAVGVVILVHTRDVSGAVEGKEVHKLLHPAAEGK